ncbi:MAG TPA: hypothetical protein VG055_14005 [Planctomycetaceae bacterium]|jgi:hypothetical protein|nr:hypothetical protein [Planctomycetaceae bacterium]
MVSGVPASDAGAPQPPWLQFLVNNSTVNSVNSNALPVLTNGDGGCTMEQLKRRQNI